MTYNVFGGTLNLAVSIYLSMMANYQSVCPHQKSAFGLAVTLNFDIN